MNNYGVHTHVVEMVITLHMLTICESYVVSDMGSKYSHNSMLITMHSNT